MEWLERPWPSSAAALVLVMGLVGCGAWLRPATEEALPPPPEAFRDGQLEVGVIVQRMREGELMVRRADGRRWVLAPKTYCSWCWMQVGKKVYLEFGATSSTLISRDGEVAEFWTRQPLD